jgi:hypothetical protein
MRKNLKESIKEALRRVMLSENNAGGHPGYTVPTTPSGGGHPGYTVPTTPSGSEQFIPVTPPPGGNPYFNPRNIQPFQQNQPSGSGNSPEGIPGYSKPYWDNQSGQWFIPGPNGYPHFYWDSTINPYTNQPNGWRPVML